MIASSVLVRHPTAAWCFSRLHESAHFAHRFEYPLLEFGRKYDALLPSSGEYDDAVRRARPILILNQQTLGSDLVNMRGMQAGRMRLLLNRNQELACPEDLIWSANQPQAS